MASCSHVAASPQLQPALNAACPADNRRAGRSCQVSFSQSLRKEAAALRLDSPHAVAKRVPQARLTVRSERRQAANSSRLALADVAQQASPAEAAIHQGALWSVHKFGGTCVGTWERIANVADIIISDGASRKFVVVSAMAKVTNALYELLKRAEEKDESYSSLLQELKERHVDTATRLLGPGQDLDDFLRQLEEDCVDLGAMLKAIFIAGNATSSFSDFVVGHGELWSAQILAGTIRKLSGAPCSFLDARSVLVVQPGPLQAEPDYEVSQAKLSQWYDDSPADIIVATGFIARTAAGIPTTLQRDGSDFSAAIFGSLLRAGQVTIWTDVDGVYSADPRKVKEAVVLKSLSYQEAWEMSYFGAKVLHPRTTQPVMKYSIPIFIRNAFNATYPGTRIGPMDESEDATSSSRCGSAESVVKGFATIDNVALINVEGTGMAGVPGTASRIFSAVRNVGANVIAISQASSEHSVCFAVPQAEAEVVRAELESTFERAIQTGNIHKIEVISQCSVLAAVGHCMASTPGVSATLFSALAKAGVNVRAIAQGCSEFNITVVVDQQDSVKALRTVHSQFYLSKTPLAVALIGPGLIGATLLQQLREQQQQLRDEMGIDIRVVAIMGLSRMLLHPTGIDLSRWQENLKEFGEAADVASLSSHLSGNHFLPNTVIVDCTASADVASLYADWLQQGFHVITPNKKANSGSLDYYRRLRSLQRSSYTHYFYEATVGAGLPILSTLHGLINAGDKIVRVEGIFSGTLSFIFNNFNGEKPFSQIVAEAKASGYTEPDPRDDLAGMDVARKVIILGRESGLPLEVDNIPVQSLVPEPLRETKDVADFMERLSEFDVEMEAKRKEAEESGEVLRYVGVVDVAKGAGSVELKRYPKSHAFAQLQGSDNIISITTKRYETQPLIVRGPGAGAEVTAGGVFCDLLRLASHLGAPS